MYKICLDINFNANHYQRHNQLVNFTLTSKPKMTIITNPLEEPSNSFLILLNFTKYLISFDFKAIFLCLITFIYV